jgi:hypothetical protein
MGLGSQEHLDVLAGGIEDGGQVGGSHLDLFSWVLEKSWYGD